MKIKRLSIIVFFCVISLFLLKVFLLNGEKCRRVDVFRTIKTGDYVSHFVGGGISVGGKFIKPAGDFFVFFINDKVDVDATLDDKQRYGGIVDKIVSRGGHFYPCGDGKVSRIFGIDIICGKEWKLDGSLIAATDRAGKIFALYENARLGDVEKVVRDLRL